MYVGCLRRVATGEGEQTRPDLTRDVAQNSVVSAGGRKRVFFKDAMIQISNVMFCDLQISGADCWGGSKLFVCEK